MTGHAYTPNHIPQAERVIHVLRSALLLAYGTYGVWVNDIYFPGRRSPGIHLHDAPAWIMWGAMVCACLVMLSVVVDHYDRRNNETNYQRFATVFSYAGWGLAALSFSMEVTSYRGGWQGLGVLCMVFVPVLLMVFGLHWLVQRQAAEDKLQLQAWRTLETDKLASMQMAANDERFKLMGQDTVTVQHKEIEKRADAGLHGLEVTRILRNPAGEYFYWVWYSSGSHYIKPITQANAKIILKEAYVAPQPPGMPG
jgi:hypothetical protein